MTAVADPPRSVTPPLPGAARRVGGYAEPAGIAVLLLGTLVAYLVNLGSNGWANSFYSAAIQAGSVSWKAWFFGSSDPANSITVDKPPLSLWLPGIAVRIFGLNSWAIQVPQVLMGVASVGLLYWITRTRFGPAAGFIAGITLALTPVAALMFRFNNPDALLVLLMIAAVGATLRAIDDGRVRWLLLAGVCVGLGFLTKQLQVFLVIPPVAVTYLIFGRTRWLTRLAHLLAAFCAMVVSAGWWVLVVQLWPSNDRPYIGGSQHNSILELTLGYNGFGRLSGNETGSVVPGGRGFGGESFGGAAGFEGFGGRGGVWGEPGFLRMFQPAQGGQIAWLIPAALILGVLGIVLCGRAPRVDARRAFFVLWGLWLLTTAAVFSFMSGIFHSYYTIALAPAIAGLVGGGAWFGWAHRDRWSVRLILAATVVISAAISAILLNRSDSFVPWLRFAVVILAVVAAVLMIVPRVRVLTVIAAALALVSGLAGLAAYAADTIATPHEGSIPTAGPRVKGGGFSFGDLGGEFGRGMPGIIGGRPNFPLGRGAGRFEGMGMGPMGVSQPSQDMIERIDAVPAKYTWAAAMIGSLAASGYQLDTGRAIMPIGGFNGSDPSPTLRQFQTYVREGKIRYFVAGGHMWPGMNAEGTAASIRSWVESHFAAETVGATTMYDLSQPTG